jgi:hypothetical protein
MNHKSEIQITPEQAIAIDSLMKFLADPDPEYQMFVLSGFAGTGKTFCMREVVARCAKSRIKFAFTAPTNKAAKVLRQVTGSAVTIYSLLGLRIDKSGELKQLITSKAPLDLSEIDAIFVDEGSMVNDRLLQILHDQCMLANVKVVFMGDSAQLPPVGEAASNIWSMKAERASLTKVMRHDNQILKFVTSVREVINSPTPSIEIRSNNDGVEGVWKMDKAGFRKALFDAACAGEFSDGSKGKAIAWRNITVNEYNNVIRAAIYGAAALPGRYLQGERIVAAAPCMRGDEQLLVTDDEALVESEIECRHPLALQYLALELLCRTEENKVIRLVVIHPESKQQFENDSAKKANEAKVNPKLWQKFWLHKELFHDVKYAYALTTHRSQGSTYESVWVDYQDILLNRNRREAFQCLYVACSRPTKRLFLA